MVTTETGTETEQGRGNGHGPARLGAGTESGTGRAWLSVTEAAARAHVQERSIRRMIARGAVVSQLTPDGRRMVLAESLPGQDPSQNPARSEGHRPNPAESQDSVRDQLQRERAMVDFLQGQLQQSRDAERELRLLLAQSTKTAQLLATPAQLPPTDATPARRIRWWWPFSRQHGPSG